MPGGRSDRTLRGIGRFACLRTVVLGLIVSLAAGTNLHAQSVLPPVGANELKSLTGYLSACLQRQTFASAGVDREVTFRFSLDQRGGLIGAPRITYLKTGGADPRGFLTDLQSALKACLPIRLSPSLGAAVAGRPLSMRLILHAKKELSI